MDRFYRKSRVVWLVGGLWGEREVGREAMRMGLDEWVDEGRGEAVWERRKVCALPPRMCVCVCVRSFVSI